MRRWLATKWRSTLTCALGLHRHCDGQALSRGDPRPHICYCDCHFRQGDE